MEWIKPEEHLPPRKEGWEHSEQILLHYPGSENDVEKYGVGYYHYSPPFAEPRFVDFCNYDRQPNFWTPIEHPLVCEERKLKEQKDAKGWEDFREGAYNTWKAKNPES